VAASSRNGMAVIEAASATATPMDTGAVIEAAARTADARLQDHSSTQCG
jgi:hypothetical protein